MGLAALVKNMHRAGLAVPALDEFLMLDEDGSEDRRDGMFHPSDLSYKFCPKAWALYNFHPQGLAVKVAGIEPRLKRIFGNGHGVHDRVQGYFQKMGALWGKWRRVIGYDATQDRPVYEYHEGFAPKSRGWEYMEVSLAHRADRIKGHTDGLLWYDGSFNIKGLRRGKKYGLEIKSIKDERYRYLQDEPQAHHREQVLIYEHCLDDRREQLQGQYVDDFDAEPLAGFIVVYECKNDQALKEFTVPYDKAEIDGLMEKKRKLMRRALEYEKTGEWPECHCGSKPSLLCEHFENL
jgi:hypothetical protein